MAGTWLTYAEAAKRLGIKPDSVKKRAMRRHWPRTVGNDGRTRVQLPDDSPETVPPDITTDSPPDTSPIDADDTKERMIAAETEVRLLRERVADLTADRDAMRDALAQAASHRQIVGGVGGFWDRLLGRTR